MLKRALLLTPVTENDVTMIEQAKKCEKAHFPGRNFLLYLDLPRFPLWQMNFFHDIILLTDILGFWYIDPLHIPSLKLI